MVAFQIFIKKKIYIDSPKILYIFICPLCHSYDFLKYIDVSKLLILVPHLLTMLMYQRGVWFASHIITKMPNSIGTELLVAPNPIG